MGRFKPDHATQVLDNRQPCRMIETAESKKPAKPISSDPPKGLPKVGKDFWNQVRAVQQSYYASGINPTVTEEHSLALEAYCLAYCNWKKLNSSIKKLEAQCRKNGEDPRIIETKDGDVKQRQIYRDEQSAMMTMMQLGKPIGLDRTAPKIAIQMNQVAKEVAQAAPDDTTNLIQLNRFAGKVVNG